MEQNVIFELRISEESNLSAESDPPNKSYIHVPVHAFEYVYKSNGDEMSYTGDSIPASIFSNPITLFE